MNKQIKRIRMSRIDVLTKIACLIICIFFLLFFTLPIIYVLFSSLSFRGSFSLDGYALLLRNKQVISGLKNSALVVSIGTLYSLVLEVPAAYVLAKKRYSKLSEFFWMLSQFSAAILPLYLLLKQLGLLNTIWSMILPSGLSIYYTHLLRARMINIANEFEDAASIDGAGVLTYLSRILMPIIGPTIGCIAFFHACSYWSSTLYAQTFITDETKYPLSIVLMELLIKNRSTDVLASGVSTVSIATIQMAEYALCVISAIPMILFFMFIKKHIRAMEYDSGIVM